MEGNDGAATEGEALNKEGGTVTAGTELDLKSARKEE